MDVEIAARLERHREVIGLGIVDDLDAGRAGEQRARLLGRHRRGELQHDRLRMGTQHRDADAGRHDRQLRLVEYLARLFDDLVLFLVVAVIRHLGVVREDVEGDLVREHRLGDLLARRVLARLVLELAHRRGAGA